MKNPFDFLEMANTYEDRKIDCTEINEVVIDTCAVTDSDDPYETGICSKHYNDGKWIIVQTYSSKQQAEEGHKEWITVFKNKDKFPETLKNVSSCVFAKLLRLVEGKEHLIKTKTK
jgi:hypothetical protein